MPATKPTVITATELKHKSGEIMRRAAQDGEHFIVERARYPIVVILAVQDYERLKARKATNKGVD